MAQKKKTYRKTKNNKRRSLRNPKTVGGSKGDAFTKAVDDVVDAWSSSEANDTTIVTKLEEMKTAGNQDKCGNNIFSKDTNCEIAKVRGYQILVLIADNLKEEDLKDYYTKKVEEKGSNFKKNKEGYSMDYHRGISQAIDTYNKGIAEKSSSIISNEVSPHSHLGSYPRPLGSPPLTLKKLGGRKTRRRRKSKRKTMKIKK